MLKATRLNCGNQPEMKLFEFEDLDGFPDFLGQGMTDYLRYFLKATSFYKPVTPLLQQCLTQSGSDRCIDLCSGGGGAIESVVKNFGGQIHFTLTDKFPNRNAFALLKNKLPDHVDFIESSVDATDVPHEITRCTNYVFGRSPFQSRPDQSHFRPFGKVQVSDRYFRRRR